MKLNPNYSNLKESYLFAEVADRTAKFAATHPEMKIIKLGIGDSKQRERFKKIYGEANKALASLVNDKSYASANDEVKAKAVRFIYDIYYNLAIEDLLGVDLETKNILFAKAIDISSLAIIVATARSLEADTDKKGNIISGSRKKKVQTYINSLGLKAAQKYMIMGYLGYSNKYGQQQVKSYIQRLSLTKSEKEKLYEYSGYAA